MSTEIKVGLPIIWSTTKYGEIIAIHEDRGIAVVEYEDGSRNEISLEHIEESIREQEDDMGMDAEYIEQFAKAKKGRTEH